MRVVKDILKPSFGRPFFVCSEKENPCSFWQWGDVLKPNCYHGLPCFTLKVKKDGANKGRLFYTCSKEKEQSCDHFEWQNEVKDEDPFKPLATVYFSNPLLYAYTVEETGERFESHHENRKRAYGRAFVEKGAIIII